MTLPLDRLLSRDHPLVSDAGRSIALLHGHQTDRVALLLHGLTASPRQFLAVAEALHAQGWNVLAVRLPRHGYSDRLTDALAGLTTAELIARSDEALDVAQGLGNRLTVVGFSVGGMLALRLAQRHELESVVAIAPFLAWRWLPYWMQPIGMRAVLAIPNQRLWWDPRLRENQMPTHGYPCFSTHAVARVYALAATVRRDAANSAPRAKRVVAILNEREAAVHNGVVRSLISAWQRHGGNAALHLLQGLPLSHDIIEPLAEPPLSQRVFASIMGKILE